MKLKVILVSLLLACANTTVNAKKSENIVVEKPKIMTTEFNPKNNKARIFKILGFLGVFREQPMGENQENKIITVDYIEYSIKPIKTYFF